MRGRAWIKTQEKSHENLYLTSADLVRAEILNKK
jgi:hypothetical protein